MHKNYVCSKSSLLWLQELFYSEITWKQFFSFPCRLSWPYKIGTLHRNYNWNLIELLQDANCFRSCLNYFSFFDCKEVFNNFYDRLRDALLSRSQISCVGDYPHKMAEIQCFWSSNINDHKCHPKRLDISRLS